MTPFDVAEYLRLLRQRGCTLGEPFEYQRLSVSTNDDAKRGAAQGCLAGATFLADEQSGGRGRRGREWFAQPGEALLFSVVLRPRLNPDALSSLTLAVGLGVREALAAHAAVPFHIKWPNDVLCGSAKIAGILVEADNASGSVVVGVGINVGTEQFPSDLDRIATSLSKLGGAPAREPLLVDVLVAVQGWVAVLERSGVAGLVRELRRWDALLGRAVVIEEQAGTARGIDDRGHLLLEVDDHVRSVRSGTVLFRHLTRDAG
jgi:BirA family biotin operon repressor/biotin-[acetyl-CoA-carboxylase] ligase